METLTFTSKKALDNVAALNVSIFTDITRVYNFLWSTSLCTIYRSGDVVETAMSVDRGSTNSCYWWRWPSIDIGSSRSMMVSSRSAVDVCLRRPTKVCRRCDCCKQSTPGQRATIERQIDNDAIAEQLTSRHHQQLAFDAAADRQCRARSEIRSKNSWTVSGAYLYTSVCNRDVQSARWSC